MEHKEKKTMTYDVRNPGHGYRHEYNCAVLNRLMGSQSSRVWLNSVHREILSSVIIVFYDKVRGRNKAQRWLILVCWDFSFEKDTIGHNFTGHYYVLHPVMDLQDQKRNWLWFIVLGITVSHCESIYFLCSPFLVYFHIFLSFQILDIQFVDGMQCRFLTYRYISVYVLGNIWK